MSKSIVLDALYPFYLGYVAKEHMVTGKGSSVIVTCGCQGTLIPGNPGIKYEMQLCPTHEATA